MQTENGRFPCLALGAIAIHESGTPRPQLAAAEQLGKLKLITTNPIINNTNQWMSKVQYQEHITRTFPLRERK